MSPLSSPPQGALLLPPLPIQPEPPPILVALPERMRQRRWTVLLRAILAFPMCVAVFAVGIAVVACTVIGWFAALASGRAPGFVRNAGTTLLRLTSRLEAYLFLLTDRLPPFSGDVPAYPIGIAIPPATRLNRAAVLFRLVLAVPAIIVVRSVGLGLYVLAVFMWVVVLITGWLPKPFHDAYGAFLRYEVRFLGYLALLVPTYPNRLFGDEWTVASAVPRAYSPGTGTSESDADHSARPPLHQRDWNLVLSSGAKRVLVLAIILGVAAVIGLQVLSVQEQNHENLVQVNNQLVSSLNTFASSAGQCGSVECLERADSELSQKLGSFVNSIESSDHAGVRQDLVDRVTTAAKKAQQATDALANSGATTPDEYRNAATRVRAAQSLRNLISAQNQFVTALNGS
jgi:hypothetical protein